MACDPRVSKDVVSHARQTRARAVFAKRHFRIRPFPRAPYSTPGTCAAHSPQPLGGSIRPASATGQRCLRAFILAFPSAFWQNFLLLRRFAGLRRSIRREKFQPNLLPVFSLHSISKNDIMEAHKYTKAGANDACKTGPLSCEKRAMAPSTGCGESFGHRADHEAQGSPEKLSRLHWIPISTKTPCAWAFPLSAGRRRCAPPWAQQAATQTRFVRARGHFCAGRGARPKRSEDPRGRARPVH